MPPEQAPTGPPAEAGPCTQPSFCPPSQPGAPVWDSAPPTHPRTLLGRQGVMHPTPPQPSLCHPHGMGHCQYPPVSFFCAKTWPVRERRRGEGRKCFDISSCGFIVSNASINEPEAQHEDVLPLLSSPCPALGRGASWGWTGLQCLTFSRCALRSMGQAWQLGREDTL